MRPMASHAAAHVMGFLGIPLVYCEAKGIIYRMKQFSTKTCLRRRVF